MIVLVVFFLGLFLLLGYTEDFKKTHVDSTYNMGIRRANFALVPAHNLTGTCSQICWAENALQTRVQ
jgi:hypothetical protein